MNRWLTMARDETMKKLLIAGVAALALAGCSADSQRDRALVGGGLGAAAGAITGAAITGDAGGALVGGVIGAAGGAMAGAATTPRNCVDRFGRRVPCP